eukprot:12069430-Alexandrium_andersonii.AAC.1
MAEIPLLKAGQQDFVKVWQRAVVEKFGTHSGQNRRHRADDMAVIDEDGISYQERIGRWTRESFRDISDCSFWRSLVIGHCTRGPVHHLMCWLQGEKGQGKGKLVELVASKAHAVMNEWTAMIEDGIAETTWDRLLGTFDPEECAAISLWTSIAVLH